MGGGGGSSDGTTILETPPYVIALVFFFFLVITLGFEKLLHLVRHILAKKGKHGLLSAMNNMQSELMCLGVATLILLLFESNITTYCINAKSYTKTWLDHVNGCSCCLSRTKGVSPCYLAAKGCVSNSVLGECCNPGVGQKPKVCSMVFDDTDTGDADTTGLYVVNSSSGEVSYNGTDARRRLQGLQTMRALLAGSSPSAYATDQEQAQCAGRIQTGWEECGFRPDYRPAIGPTALHQIHMFIFITAIVHIFLGIFLIVVATLRLHLWRRWRSDEDADFLMVQQAVDDHSEAIASAMTIGKLESQREEDEEGMDLDERASSVPRSMHPNELPSTFDVERSPGWTGRPEKLRGFGPRLREAAACLGRQFMPSIVSKEEFALMRSSFVLTHHIRSSSGFNFFDYLRNAMEEDFAHVVGLGLPMWCFIIVFVLLSSAIGWCIWVFAIISGFLLAVLNTKLVWIARYAARGGHVHKLKPGIFWLNRPWLMLPFIKFLLFFVSYTYANAIFFASEFGSTSCFFSAVGFQKQPVPWWVVMMVNTIFLVSLSLVTLPLYAVTVQMGGDFKAQLLPDEVLDNAARVQSLQASNSKGLRKLLSSVLPKERDVTRPLSSQMAAGHKHGT